MGLLLTGALAYQASRVEFRFVSDDLAPPTPAMTTLNTVIREFGGDVWLSYYFRFFVDRPEDIRPLEEKLLQSPSSTPSPRCASSSPRSSWGGSARSSTSRWTRPKRGSRP